MNARLELLTSPVPSAPVPPAALLACCGPRELATEAPAIVALLFAAAESALHVAVKFAAASRRALFPTGRGPADAIILK